MTFFERRFNGIALTSTLSEGDRVRARDSLSPTGSWNFINSRAYNRVSFTQGRHAIVVRNKVLGHEVTIGEQHRRGSVVGGGSRALAQIEVLRQPRLLQRRRQRRRRRGLGRGRVDARAKGDGGSRAFRRGGYRDAGRRVRESRRDAADHAPAVRSEVRGFGAERPASSA